jgi:hypothetical protein
MFVSEFRDPVLAMSILEAHSFLFLSHPIFGNAIFHNGFLTLEG